MDSHAGWVLRARGVHGAFVPAQQLQLGQDSLCCRLAWEQTWSPRKHFDSWDHCEEFGADHGV